jgi:hypothetical protein
MEDTDLFVDVISWKNWMQASFLPARQNFLVAVWADGLHASSGYSVVGVGWLVSEQKRSQLQTLFKMRCSDEQSLLSSCALSFIPLSCGGNGCRGVLTVLDHAMCFKYYGIRSKTYRHPGVVLLVKNQNFTLFAPMRTVQDIQAKFCVLVDALKSVSTKGHAEDCTKKQLKELVLVLKSGVCQGAVDTPYMLQNTKFDPRSDYENFGALLLLHKATAWEAEGGDAFVIVNMRSAAPLQKNGKLSLKQFLPSTVRSMDISVCDELGAKIMFNGEWESMEVLVSGSYVFFRYLLHFDPERIILAPPSLHSTLFMKSKIFQLLEANLVAGGRVFDTDTKKLSPAQLKDLVSAFKGYVLGKGAPVHNYVNL